MEALPEVSPELAAALLGAEATPGRGAGLPDGLMDGLPRPLALGSAEVLQGLPDAPTDARPRLGRHGDDRAQGEEN